MIKTPEARRVDLDLSVQSGNILLNQTKGNIMQKIELLGNRDEVVILHTALMELMDRIEQNGNLYGMAEITADLIEQVEYIKMNWED